MLVLIPRKAPSLSLSRTRARYLHRPKAPPAPIPIQQAALALGGIILPIDAPTAVLAQLPATFDALLAQASASQDL